MELVWRLWAQRYTAFQCVPIVNEWCLRKGEPPVTEKTVYLDRGRIKALIGEGDADAKAAHHESWALVIREAWRAFHATASSSLNRSGYLNTIASTEERLAKLDGSLAPQRVQIEARVRDGRFDAAGFERPGVRAALDALYDALDADDAAGAGAAGPGSVLALPPTPALPGAHPAGGRNGAAPEGDRELPPEVGEV
ncbi:MAG TPA: hypothetical protein VMW49_07350 [Candidatus Dormibacteraeota bacterium]|nr:hypothetical protein [Candidatus Dormibacteraeota bacterium]